MVLTIEHPGRGNVRWVLCFPRINHQPLGVLSGQLAHLDAVGGWGESLLLIRVGDWTEV